MQGIWKMFPDKNVNFVKLRSEFSNPGGTSITRTLEHLQLLGYVDVI